MSGAIAATWAMVVRLGAGLSRRRGWFCCGAPSVIWRCSNAGGAGRWARWCTRCCIVERYSSGSIAVARALVGRSAGGSPRLGGWFSPRTSSVVLRPQSGIRANRPNQNCPRYLGPFERAHSQWRARSRRAGRRAIGTRARPSPRLLARRRPKRLRWWSCPSLGFLAACCFERARCWYSIGSSDPIVRFLAVRGRRRGIASDRAGAAASMESACLCLPALVQSGASVELEHPVPAASFRPTRSRG